MIHLHRLKLTGPERSYEVNFDERESNLVIIAGPINTGKTTTLQLVDYLLGADSHPQHPELSRRVRSAALEFTSNGKRWTLERPLFGATSLAFIKSGGIDETNEIRPLGLTPSDPNSISKWLLREIGLEDMQLKVTANNPNSQIHELSMRDLMWVTYLPSKRLDNDALLHEPQDQKHYKLRQVIELLFDVHDDRLAALMRQRQRLQEELRAEREEVRVLETFLKEENVAGPPELEIAVEKITAEIAKTSERIEKITKEAASSTEYANDLRRQYADQKNASGEAAARLRDRETLLERLMLLRGQYAEDERKLALAAEAKRLFDPLHVRTCPACLQRVDDPEIKSGVCTLCSQKVDAEDADETFDLARERRALRKRLQDLDNYTESIQVQLDEAAFTLRDQEEEEARLAAALDSETATDLSPYIAERDQLHERRSRLEAELGQLERALSWQASLERRRGQVGQLTEKLERLREELAERREDQPDKATVVAEVSERFASLLREWKFPKVDDEGPPYVDERFIPHVGNRVYREIGSDGAKTLIAEAWALAIYELAIEHGAPHPGFLMMDALDKNLSPAPGREDDDYVDEEIVQAIYRHLERWTEAHPEAQVIVVDHEPPAFVADKVVVRYTRRPDTRPYGLIEDQVGSSAA